MADSSLTHTARVVWSSNCAVWATSSSSLVCADCGHPPLPLEQFSVVVTDRHISGQKGSE